MTYYQVTPGVTPFPAQKKINKQTEPACRHVPVLFIAGYVRARHENVELGANMDSYVSMVNSVVKVIPHFF